MVNKRHIIIVALSLVLLWIIVTFSPRVVAAEPSLPTGLGDAPALPAGPGAGRDNANENESSGEIRSEASGFIEMRGGLRTHSDPRQQRRIR